MQIRPQDLVGMMPDRNESGTSRLALRIDQSIRTLRRAAEEHDLTSWVVMYSGGKDSTTALILALEAAKQSGKVEQIDVVFSNTGVEIPSLAIYAEEFLQKLDTKGLNVKKHVVKPADEHGFWTLIIGKGYPPPHRNFRWCTDKLKVRPAEQIIRSVLRPHRTAILTGVRFGESDARDQRLNLSCSRGGECGQGLWVEQSTKLNAVYLGPIVAWRECDVWDFLDYQAPSWGYSTESLRPLYQGPKTRFGCWTCTVVQRDKTMAKIVETEEGKDLLPMKEMRDWLIEFGRDADNRVKRQNGIAGRLSLDARRKILEKLTEAEKALGKPLLSESDRTQIAKLWEDPAYGDSYDRKVGNEPMRLLASVSA